MFFFFIVGIHSVILDLRYKVIEQLLKNTQNSFILFVDIAAVVDIFFCRY